MLPHSGNLKTPSVGTSVRVRALVMGMGAYVFGRERRAMRTLGRMERVGCYFLSSQFGDGSVDKLLEQHGFEYERVAFGYLGRAHPIWTLITLAHMPLLFFKIVRAYLRQRCNTLLLVCIEPLIAALPPILLLRLLCRARVVLYLGDIPSDRRVHRFVARVINSLAERIVVNSRAVSEGLQTLGVNPNKIQVTYNGVDVEAFRSGGDTDFRKMYDWQSDSVLIGYVGQFRTKKGIWEFLNAADRVLCEDDTCRFVMIGKADPNDDTEREVQQHLSLNGRAQKIVVAGWIENMEDAYCALDVLVVPSQYDDPAPNVSIEAMASGVPVVATAVGGIGELVADGETGFLVGKGRSDELAERILQLTRDRVLRETMGRAGCQRAQQLFNRDTNVRLVENVILNV